MAEKLQNEEINRLLAERRLSLIVDLDQTIVHAWDDPAIENWIIDPHHPYHAAAKAS
jgi:RNA polymerase II subunit A-like phosphatase